MTLNERAWNLADEMAGDAELLRIAVHRGDNGARILDCGIAVPGGLKAGVALARVCLAGLADVTVNPATLSDLPCPQIQVTTDHPVAACMASQYAGWQVKAGKYFAMGSGPMRAALGRETLFDHIPGREQSPVAVGVLETRKLPTPEVLAHLAEKLQLPGDRLTLLAAPASSLAGTVQVVARSVETTLHKLHELKFDLAKIVAGYGTAPLPPVAAEEETAIGRTNDAILYGGQVTLWVRADDAELKELGPRVPATASHDYGAPFVDVLNRYQHDFYKIDPLLFSPARVVIHNVTTGCSHIFGQLNLKVLHLSFFGD
jgi:methenyltetrahydromethanopterin cyclohydrolase